jgi:prolipoprotein diacylglyceryltransferase
VYPILFSVGGFKMHAYGLFAALAMIAAGLIVQRLSRRLGVDSGAALELTVAAIIGGLVGARLYWPRSTGLSSAGIWPTPSWGAPDSPGTGASSAASPR